jgi:histidinol-phosphate phosphatase family protein
VTDPIDVVRPGALLCDRDGTLVADVPYNDDPALVAPLSGVAAALQRVRAAGIPVGIVTNQRGVALGRITPERLVAVHARVEQLLGPFDVIVSCPHDAFDRCTCRKPRPGLVLQAARRLRVPVERCVVVGDSWSDVLAARSAGARPILVGASSTRPDDGVGGVLAVADLPAAVDVLLAGCVAA